MDRHQGGWDVGLLVRHIWLALTVVMTIVLATLSILAILQHDAILSNLIRQRLSVVVGSTAAPFRSVVELGLPVSMMRNATELLQRASETDPLIKSVHLINPSGIVVDSTLSGDVEPMPREIVRALVDSTDGRWSAETDTDLISGYSILDEGGTPVGGVVASYPKIELESRSGAIRQRMGLVSAILLVLFSIVSYLALRVKMRGPVSELRWIAKRLDGSDEQAPAEVSAAMASFPALSEMLERASLAYRSALSELAQFSSPAPDARLGNDASASVRFVGIAETDLARNIARRLMPLVAAMVFGSALTLAYVAYLGIGESFSPEIAKRTELIGTVANANVQRAIEAGVPLDQLVGGEEYFQDLTRNFPEISYLGILPGKPILEVGRKRSAAEGISEFPLVLDGETIGTIVTETDPLYFAAQFRDMMLDLSVVLLVIVLFAFELVVVMMTSSVTLPIDGLQHVAGLHAASDFSKRLAASGKNVIGRLAGLISERALRLNGMFAEARRLVIAGRDPEERTRLEALGRRFGLRESGAEVLRFCSLSDVRLPLFLFAMADELPLSFFSLYARDADNPITWISPGIVIGLPLAAYLMATLFGAPLARPLERRFGYRNLFLAGAGMCMLANVGLFAADNIVHLIACLALNGLGFVLASLSCQDYVLDILPPAVRSRSIGLIRTAMFSGVFAGTALGGIIADRMGQRAVFIVCAVVMAVSAVLIRHNMPQFRAGIGEPSEQEGARISFNLLAPMRSARFAAIAFGIVVPLAIVDHVFVSYLLSLQMDALGSSAAGIGRAMMGFFLMLIIGGSVHDKVPRRYSNPALIAFASSVVSGGVLLVAAAFPSTASMFLTAAIAGLGLGLAGGPQAVLVMDLAEGRLAHLGSSAVLGTMRLLERGGAVVGLVLTGLLTGYIGYSGAVGAIGCLVLFGAVVFALFHAAERKSMRENVVRSTTGALVAFMLATGWFASPAEAARKTIAMVVWIGCEDVCQGVKDFVADSGMDADVAVFDAAEDASKLPGIVDELRKTRPDLVITWGTKVTLGVVGSLDERNDPRFLSDIPVVFTVVSNPVGTKIIESYEKTGRPNVTGTRNRVPESVNIKSIRRYMKNFAHLGILYDTSEANSVAKVDEIKALTEELNFSLTALPLAAKADGTPDPASVAPKVQELKQAGVQFIYLGSSTFLEKQQDLFTGAALEAGLPILSPYEHLVSESNALMSVAARDYDVGKLAARQASRILVDGSQPGDLPVLAMEEFAYLVNMRVAKQLNLFPPVEFLQFVEKVE
jgi:ABC-type uncharacterized transport system substrate-binding protein/predicted MFS family arabinose efflux permease